MHSIKTNKNGFTLIELLVVIGISALLTTLVITFSSVGRNETTLATQVTTIAQVIARAKSLSTSAYINQSNGQHTCAYGVLFDQLAGTYSVVSYNKPAGSTFCSSVSALQSSGISAGNLSMYDPNDANIPLNAGVKYSAASGNMLTLVIFYPPNPTVLMSQSRCVVGDASCSFTIQNQPQTIPLATTDGAASRAVTVGTQGEIDW